MDFANVARILLRHWVVLLLGVALSVGSAFLVYRTTPRSYEAVSQVMVLLRPTAQNPEIETSPFLYLPDGLTALARVVTLIPNTPEYRNSMAAAGFEPDYSVDLQARDPIVLFTVAGPDPDNVLRTRDELMDRFAADLDRVQEEEGVPDRQWAHFRVLQTSDIPTALSDAAFKRAAGVGAIGGLLTLLGVALVERRSRRRALRAVRAEGLATAGEDGSAGSAPRRKDTILGEVEEPALSRATGKNTVHAAD